MSPDVELGKVLRRIAVIPNIVRTRQQDGERSALNGGSNGERDERIRDLVARLEKLASDMEKAIA